MIDVNFDGASIVVNDSKCPTHENGISKTKSFLMMILKKNISFAIFDIASLPNKMDDFKLLVQNNPVDVIS